MIDELKPGTLLVRTNVVLPRSLASNGETVFPGWKVLRNIDAATMERETREVGWHFFFVVPPMEAAAFARSKERALIEALKKILANAESWNLNAVEITRVKARNFWFFHRALIAANIRHVGAKPVLSEVRQPERQSLVAETA